MSDTGPTLATVLERMNAMEERLSTRLNHFRDAGGFARSEERVARAFPVREVTPCAMSDPMRYFLCGRITLLAREDDV